MADRCGGPAACAALDPVSDPRGDRSAGPRAAASAVRRVRDSDVHARDSVVPAPVVAVLVPVSVVPVPGTEAPLPTAGGEAHRAADSPVRVPEVSVVAPREAASAAPRVRVVRGVRRSTIDVRRRVFPTARPPTPPR